MTTVASDLGVGGDAGFEVVVIFPREVEGGGKGLVDVAGGAENASDDCLVGAETPFLGLAGGKPIAGGFRNGFAEGDAVVHRVKNARETVGSAQDVGVPMGEGDMFLHGGAPIGVFGESGEEGGDLGEAADVLVFDAALCACPFLSRNW